MTVSDPVAEGGGTPADGTDRPAPAARGGVRRRVVTLVVTALAVLAADVVSKVLVVATLSDRAPVRLAGGLVYLTETRNSGAAFSFAEGATVLFTLIAALVVAVILRSAARLYSRPWAVCLGLILGGASGNLTDRLFRAPGPLRGAVVDWISLFDKGGRVWPIFNLADSAIVCGGVFAVLLVMLGREMDGSGEATATAAGSDAGDRLVDGPAEAGGSDGAGS